ncbi:hypothetical protein BDZ45DRAFT_252178 [Acephala macrosclerotiorum]|nr:hypothetical protein BDZ45DRAFT_252178 [Acephala macrosclerotiorum]
MILFRSLAFISWPYFVLIAKASTSLVWRNCSESNPPHRMKISIPNTILMANSNRDPECSYVWANSLKDQIVNSVLLTRDGDGYTSYRRLGRLRRRLTHILLMGQSQRIALF